jgi:hypothetical protein
MHARVIAGSATTNILTNLTLEQQARLQASEKQLEDMKAALHLVCGVLRQTNYAEARVRRRVASALSGRQPTCPGCAVCPPPAVADTPAARPAHFCCCCSCCAAQGGLRDTLDSDTLCVLDTIMATEEMEAGLAEAVAAQQQQMGLLQQEGSFGAAAGAEAAAGGGVQIEEVVEGDAFSNAAASGGSSGASEA